MMQVTRAAFQAKASLNQQATDTKSHTLVRTFYTRFSSVPLPANSDGRHVNTSPNGSTSVGIVYKRARLGSITQVQRIEGQLFETKEQAEQHGVELCKQWIDKQVRARGADERAVQYGPLVSGAKRLNAWRPVRKSVPCEYAAGRTARQLLLRFNQAGDDEILKRFFDCQLFFRKWISYHTYRNDREWVGNFRGLRVPRLRHRSNFGTLDRTGRGI
jgi:hypothetical protein